MVGGEDEAGSCRPCRPETPARHHKQAAPGTQGGRILLCVRECVSGSEKRVTEHTRAVRGKSCDGRAILYYENKPTAQEQAGKAKQGRARQGSYGPDQMGRTHLCTNQRHRSGGPKCPSVASASLTNAAHSRLALVLPSCLPAAAAAGWRAGTCWLLLAPVVSVLWAGDLAGAPCADTFLGGS